MFKMSILVRVNMRTCILTAIFLDIGVYGNIIQLTPSEVHVIENASSTLTCSKTNGNLIQTIWKNYQISGYAAIAFVNNECKTTTFLTDSDLFTGVCNLNGTYSVQLKRIDRQQHGAIWSCAEGISSDISSNSVVINVAVPATGVVLRQGNVDYFKENISKNISCNTTACRPDPKVQWYLLESETNVVYNMTHFSNFTFTDSEYGLKTVESILNFKQSRTVNGFRLYCEVWTRSDKADIASRQIVVNVTYPPDNNPKINDVEPNSTLHMIEFDTGTFVCSVTGGNPLALLRWYCFGNNKTTFDSNGRTVSSTIKWTAFRSYNKCSCEAQHLNNWRRISNANLNVQYPPAKPNLIIESKLLIGDVQIIRNNSLQVVCRSVSNPIPKYTWTGPGNSSKDGETLNLTSVQMSDQGLYMCNASNKMTRSNKTHEYGSNTSSFKLTMLYPPGIPKLRFGNKTGQLLTSNILNVVQKDSFIIHCDADGNPVPYIAWNNNKSHFLSISSIFSDTNRTCIATNLMKETSKEIETNATSLASLTITVLYPPRVPTINISNINGTTVQGQEQIISIVESDSIYLTCFSKSKPKPTYQWVHGHSSEILHGDTSKMQNISRNASGTYTCNVQNFMNRSNGTTEEGTNKSKTTLNILFPATVDSIEGKSVVEGSQVEKICPVINGNPSSSTVVWSRLIDLKRWNNKLLYIRNVSRTDDSDYTCSVTTEMFPTFGRILKIEKKQTFHLNVFFQTEITSFSFNTSSKGNIFIMNTLEPANLVCVAEANPSSNLTIENAKDGVMTSVSNSNIARHTIQNASCANAGEYMCIGRNKYTGILPAKLSLTLIVKCPPKPSSGDTSAAKLATVLNVNVSLQFSALDYLDEPDKTKFTWFKDNDSRIENDSKYIIITEGLQSNLTIRNATIHDLGLYRVSAKNTVGEYDHFYNVMATDKPDPPTDFMFINDSITDKSVKLTWIPGFNGGFQQTFVIFYKAISSSLWLNSSVIDTEKKTMNITLHGLKSNHAYQVEMFAKSREGNSAKTKILRFKTKASLTNPVESSSGNNTGTFVGVALGSIVSTLVIVTIALIGYKRFRYLRKARCNRQSRGENQVSQQYTDLDSSKRDINVYESVQNTQANTYEQLDIAKHKSSTNMELTDKNAPSSDISDYVNIRI